MGNLLIWFKKALEKWNGFSIIKKISLSVIAVVVIVLIVSLSIYAGTTKYGVLFSNMDSTDSSTVLAQLKSSKVSYKVQGNSILVPVNQVDTLRLQLASSITNGSKGFELFDSASQFGMTDQQMTIDYQRALEGELERTIKGFPQVDGARVHLVMEQDSAFVKDSTPATASVTLKLKSGYDLSTDQVKAMIALITGAVKNLPKENVQIIDDKMRLLSAGIYDSSTDQAESSAASTEKQQAIKTAYENSLVSKALAVVQPIAGSGHVKVTVNADLNFDAISQDTITYDPKSVPVSQKSTKSTTTSNSGTQSGQSTVDANTNSSVVSYPSTTQNSGTNGSSSEDNTINYDVGQTEVKTVVAPGAVKRLTAAVIIDGTLSDQDKAQIKDLVSNAIGYDDARKDNITVTGMHFDTSAQNSAKSDIAQMNTLSKQQAQSKLYSEIGIGAGALIVLSILFFSLRKRSNGDGSDMTEAKASGKGLDVQIGDEINPKEISGDKLFQPIDFEPNDQKAHLEKEIRKYATEKPDQVIDVIKSWISDDER